MVNYLISGTGSFKRQTNKYTVEFFDDDIENLNFIFYKKPEHSQVRTWTFCNVEPKMNPLALQLFLMKILQVYSCLHD